MHAPHDDERLSRIGTQWTMVFGARGEAGAADDLRCRLLLRYRRAAFQYVLGAVRDADVAEELCQEFSVRLLRGDFRAAAPERGRFRDYLKTALVNLVNDYWRNRAKQPKPLPDQVAEPLRDNFDDSGARFAAVWRAELLERTWQGLAHERPNYHAVLLARIENPEMTSNELAALLSSGGPTTYTPANIRKTLERAHARFADLLLDEVAASLDDGMTHDRLAEELRDLDLLRYCRSALERRDG